MMSLPKTLDVKRRPALTPRQPPPRAPGDPCGVDRPTPPNLAVAADGHVLVVGHRSLPDVPIAFIAHVCAEP